MGVANVDIRTRDRLFLRRSHFFLLKIENQGPRQKENAPTGTYSCDQNKRKMKQKSKPLCQIFQQQWISQSVLYDELASLHKGRKLKFQFDYANFMGLSGLLASPQSELQNAVQCSTVQLKSKIKWRLKIQSKI